MNPINPPENSPLFTLHMKNESPSLSGIQNPTINVSKHLITAPTISWYGMKISPGNATERLTFNFCDSESMHNHIAIKILSKEKSAEIMKNGLSFLQSFFWRRLLIDDGTGEKIAILVNISSARKRLSTLGFSVKEVDDLIKDKAVLNKDLANTILVKELSNQASSPHSSLQKIIRQAKGLHVYIEKTAEWIQNGVINKEDFEKLANYCLSLKTERIVDSSIYGDTWTTSHDYFHFDVDQAEKNKDRFLINELFLKDPSEITPSSYLIFNENKNDLFEIVHTVVQKIAKEKGLKKLPLKRNERIKLFESALEICAKEMEEMWFDLSELEKTNRNPSFQILNSKLKNRRTSLSFESSLSHEKSSQNDVYIYSFKDIYDKKQTLGDYKKAIIAYIKEQRNALLKMYINQELKTTYPKGNSTHWNKKFFIEWIESDLVNENEIGDIIKSTIFAENSFESEDSLIEALDDGKERFLCFKAIDGLSIDSKLKSKIRKDIDSLPDCWSLIQLFKNETEIVADPNLSSREASINRYQEAINRYSKIYDK